MLPYPWKGRRLLTEPEPGNAWLMFQPTGSLCPCDPRYETSSTRLRAISRWKLRLHWLMYAVRKFGSMPGGMTEGLPENASVRFGSGRAAAANGPEVCRMRKGELRESGVIPLPTICRL